MLLFLESSKANSDESHTRSQHLIFVKRAACERVAAKHSYVHDFAFRHKHTEHMPICYNSDLRVNRLMAYCSTIKRNLYPKGLGARVQISSFQFPRIYEVARSASHYVFPTGTKHGDGVGFSIPSKSRDEKIVVAASTARRVCEYLRETLTCVKAA